MKTQWTKQQEITYIYIFMLAMAAYLSNLTCSGDTDSVVPVTATRFSLSHLNLTIKTPWYPWYTGGQVYIT